MGHLTEKMELIPARLIKCHQPEGFIKEVESRIGPGKTQKDAYYELEAEMETYFGSAKYSGYNTFVTIRCRYQKSKTSKK